jgi:hypothetical protein
MSAKKEKYSSMIVEAILTLGERTGSSREAIWKFLLVKFPESVRDKKVFLVQLKRLTVDGKHVEKSMNNSNRYKVSSTLRNRFLKSKARGDSLNLSITHALTTKTNNTKKKASKMTKAKMSKT